MRAWAKRIAEGLGHERAAASGGGLLAPFEHLIAEMVERDMSAVQIHRELSAREDFNASYVTVRRRVRALKHRNPQVYCRMRYAPGELGQVDFGDVGRFEVAGQLTSVTAGPIRSSLSRPRRPKACSQCWRQPFCPRCANW